MESVGSSSTRTAGWKMGKDNGGIRHWHRDCDICGKRYNLTNFMRRTVNGKRTNTHLIACQRKKDCGREQGK